MTSVVLSLISVAIAGYSAVAGGSPTGPAAGLRPCSEYWAPLEGGAQYRFSEPYSAYAKRVNRKGCYKEWTVLVYMAADNDLTPYAYWDLYEMEAGFKSGNHVGASTFRSDLVVQLDSAGDRGIRRLHMFQAPQVYDDSLRKDHFDRMSEAEIRSPVVALLPEQTESEASRYRKFLMWGMREYPSRHYLVITWGHGQGWAPAQRPGTRAKSRFLTPNDVPRVDPVPASGGATPGADDSPFEGRAFGGLAFNSSKGTYLDIPSLRGVLKSVSDSVLGGRPVDLYASDACLMQMAEVATEISDVARFVVGTTQVQNFLGLPYRRIMYEINTGRFAGEKKTFPSADEPFWVAHMMPKLFKAAMTPNGLQGRIAPEAIKTITMSALSSSELVHALLPSFSELGSAIHGYLAEDPLRGMDLQFVMQNAPTVQGGAQEIGAFLTLLEELLRNEAQSGGGYSPAAAALRRAVRAVHDAQARTVLDYALGTRYTGLEQDLYMMGFRAVSVWLPASPEDYAARVRDFETSRFYRALPSWRAWLAEVYRHAP